MEISKKARWPFLMALPFFTTLFFYDDVGEFLENTAPEPNYFVCWEHVLPIGKIDINVRKCDMNVDNLVDFIELSVKDSYGIRRNLVTCEDRGLDGITKNECSYNLENIEKYFIIDTEPKRNNEITI